MRKGLIFVITAILAITMLATPVFAWFYNDYPTAAPNDSKFEKFGPRCNRMLIKLYASAEGEWEALKADPQELDMTDWPLTQTYYNQLTTTYKDDTNVVNVGGEFGIRILDMNNNPNRYLGAAGGNPNYPNPVANRNDSDPKNDYNPMSDVNMRRAVLGAIDRDYYISNIIGSGSGVPLWCALPPVTGAAYYDPSYMQGYLYSNAQAEGNLTAGKFKVNTGTGYRYWDRNDDGAEQADEWVELKFIYRSDDVHRTAAGLHIIAALQACELRINIMPLTSTGAKAQWMVSKDAHLYTAGWSLGSEPDSIVLWMGDAGVGEGYSYYWHPGQCYNTGYANDAAFNVAARHVEVANSISEAVTNMAICNARMANQALGGPMFCYSSSMANARKYVGGTGDETAYVGQYWNGTTLVGGYGTDSFFGFLNMHPQGYERPQYGTIRYGFKTSEIKSFNPIYAEWVWDNNVLGLIYDSLIATNPNDLNDRMPWATKAYEVGTYPHPTLGTCTKIRFYLREDMYWSDGTPVTMKDIYFTLVELDDLLRAKGYPNPWWYSSVKSILSFSILDPYTFEVLINVKSIWAFGLTGAGVYLLPKHIWEPIIATGDPTATAPDVNMIGSGPWRLSEYTGFSHVGLVANSPGSTVTTSGTPFSGSTAKTSTKGFHSYYPVRTDYTWDGEYDAKMLTTGSHNLSVNLFNEYYDGAVTVSKIVKVDGHVQGTWSGPIPARSWHNETFAVILGYGKHTVDILVNITAPAVFAYNGAVDPWIWVTKKEDIAGTMHLGNPCPDIKVRVDDVLAAANAFGSNPGDVRWNSAADVNLDYKIRVDDILAIALNFGWTG